MKYELPQLPYPYDALEPYIDARTMEFHHAKHHATYAAKLNEALEKYPDMQNKTLEELLQSLERVPEAIRGAVRNHGGGHHNHSLFWRIMAPVKSGGGGGEPKSAFVETIAHTFKSFTSFKDQFTAAAAGVFGSGWAWLAHNTESRVLEVITTPNQDSPLMKGYTPLLGLDVWEHAYYLKYQNRRPEYIEAWWHIVNWKEVERNFTAVKVA